MKYATAEEHVEAINKPEYKRILKRIEAAFAASDDNEINAAMRAQRDYRVRHRLE